MIDHAFFILGKDMRLMTFDSVRAGRLAAVWGEAFAAACLLAAIAAAAFLDAVTNTLLLLSTFLFFVVCRYARRYMAGDPGQVRFTLWLCSTAAFVFALILSRNLLFFAFAWCGISLSLHQLLQFYRDRPGAIMAARKKFLISRLGDLSFAAALVLTYRQFGTWDFQKLSSAAGVLRNGGNHPLPVSIGWLAALLVFAALLKSAQFPFHTWLPDTMETPTPVSALMHAGIINAGGILVIRLSPPISLSGFAMDSLCVFGAFTALFASLVMLTQASVKRCLAFSTVAQMGFMMLECGLGAFHLALLHIVAHSLYKAQAFLSTGTVSPTSPKRQPTPTPWAPVAGLMCAAAITLTCGRLVGVSPFQQPLLSAIFTVALAQMLWSCWTQLAPLWLFPIGLAAGAAYFALERAAGLAIQPLPRNFGSLDVAILLAFLLIALMQTFLAPLSGTSLGRQLFVHARNGFYFNTLANRITSALWPNAPPEGAAR